MEFQSGGDIVRGWLYTPDRGDGPFPTIVMAGGWCYVKELVQPHYAEMYANAGLAALLFDYRNFGSSDGARRQHIDPNMQLADYRNAISFAETLDEVDAERIGVWGLSYSGGHALILGATDPRVKCVASQIPVIDGYRNMRRVHGTVGFRKFQELLLEDRRRRFATGEDGFLPHAAPDPLTEISTWPFAETYSTFVELKAAEAPAYENRSTIESAELLMSYSVDPFLPRLLDVPTLVVVAEEDDLTLWIRDRGLRAHSDRQEAPGRDRQLDAHDAVQRPLAAAPGGAGGDRVVRRASGRARARKRGMTTSRRPTAASATKGGRG
ncbi:MAG: alpha/beta fold hydrolase [Solirubrobacterales bacterium]